MTVIQLPLPANGQGPMFRNPDPERGSYNRPYVFPPGVWPDPANPRKGRKLYTRATTVAATLEDRYNLEKWEQRQIAIGYSLRPDLGVLVHSYGPQPVDEQEAKAWKRNIDRCNKDAKEAAESSAPANIGTALHKYTERWWRGQDLGKVPEKYVGHLQAYEQAVKAIRPVSLESFVVLDDLKIGGTPDQIGEVDSEPTLKVIDTKSGNTFFGLGTICMQLAIYAHSLYYNAETAERRDYTQMHGKYIDLERALVVALDRKTGQCKLIWVDIAAGWQAVTMLAMPTREWRYNKNLSWDYQPPGYESDLVAEAKAKLVTCIMEAPDRATLKELHDNFFKVWGDEHSDLANRRWRALT